MKFKMGLILAICVSALGAVGCSDPCGDYCDKVGECGGDADACNSAADAAGNDDLCQAALDQLNDNDAACKALGGGK